jgi:hypothetical protein
MRADDDLREEIALLVRRRPGWSLQAVSTPGAPPVWCFGSAGTNELSVTARDGSIDVYIVDLDQNVTLGTPDQLVAWLRAYKAEALQDPRGGVIEGLKERRSFRWD